MKWISAHDSPPDTGFKAIVYYNGRVKEAILTDRVSRNTKYRIWVDCFGEEIHTVTHWIPFVEPPYKEVNPHPIQK